MALPDIETLLDIGIALSKEKNTDKLFETILDAAMDITSCDGGTLYILKDEALWFKILITKSLRLRQGTDGQPVSLPPVSLSASNVCSCAAVGKEPINIADVYINQDFNFTGTKEYDKLIGYKTTSMLTVPMEDDHGDVIGVLQLINALDENGACVPFPAGYERIIFSLASQTAICLANRNYAAEVAELHDSFVRVMAAAIDARSPYTANHTRNMAQYAARFAAWLNDAGEESLTGERERQLLMSVWLHDIGKLVVPLEIMDKESRLGPKLDTVRLRLRMMRMQAEINCLRGVLSSAEHERVVGELDHVRELVEAANKSAYLTDGMLAELCALSKKTAPGPDGEESYLMPDELVSLSVRKGTLTDEERRVMESHVLMTRRMLAEMNFPKRYRSVPGWASSHHELLSGKGYPDKLAGEDIALEVRILTIIDIYDALTACDRPYKQAMPVEEAFSVMDAMAAGGQIDTRLLTLFKQSEAWKGDGLCCAEGFAQARP